MQSTGDYLASIENKNEFNFHLIGNKNVCASERWINMNRLAQEKKLKYIDFDGLFR